MNVNFAERAHNHNWKLDPIVRSLLDTDFYKLLMLQFIWKNFPAVHVTSEVVNRTARVRLADEVDAPALIAQMEHLRGLRFRRSELIWLAGNTFYGTRHIFEPAFLAWLETDFRLSDYTVTEHDGQLTLRFSGLWTEVTMWEVYALALVSEMRTRAALARLNEMELDVLYARAKTRLWEKIERLRATPEVSISEFGTRRRHSFLWQEYVIESLRATLGPSLAGSSNTFLAYKHDLEAMGTNAHELPMAMAALADDAAALPPRSTACWSYGRRATAASCSSCCPTPSAPRSSSKARPTGSPTGPASASTPRTPSSPATSTSAGSRRVAATRARSASSPPTASTSRRFSTCTPTSTAASASPPAGARCSPTTSAAAIPAARRDFEPISLVCKLMTVEGRPAVKLSDNPRKSTGPADEIARYRRVFNSPASDPTEVLV